MKAKSRAKWLSGMFFALMFTCLWCGGMEVRADFSVKVGQTISISDTNYYNGGIVNKSWSTVDSDVVSIFGNGTTCMVTGLAPGRATVRCYTSAVKTYQIWVPGYDGYVSSGHYETRYIYNNCTKYYDVVVKAQEPQQNNTDTPQTPTKQPGNSVGGTKYTVKFIGNGGTAGGTEITCSAGSTLGNALPQAFRRGYKFTGWFTKARGGSKVTATTPCNGNMTCYAHWSKVKVYSAKIRSVKPGKGSIRIKIKKSAGNPGDIGYQIAYSTKKKMKNAEKLIYKKADCTVYALKHRKNYFVKVRAFRTDSVGNRVYGKWSKAVKCKTK